MPSEASSISHYSAPQMATSKLLPKTSNWSPIAPAENQNGGNGAYASCEFDSTSKRGKRRGVMAPDEAREVSAIFPCFGGRYADA